MLEAIASDDEKLSHGNIISVHTGTDQAVTGLTDHGIEKLRDTLRDARCTPPDWEDFLEYCVAEPDVIAPVKEKRPAVATGPLPFKRLLHD